MEAIFYEISRRERPKEKRGKLKDATYGAFKHARAVRAPTVVFYPLARPPIYNPRNQATRDPDFMHVHSNVRGFDTTIITPTWGDKRPKGLGLEPKITHRPGALQT